MKKNLLPYLCFLAAVLPVRLRAQVVLEVNPSEPGACATINDALQIARAAWTNGEKTTTILIAPGTYEEELTIDVPGLRLQNAAAVADGKTPETTTLGEYTGMRNGGVGIAENAVRITWYYGHGYQYASMGDQINYGGSRTRRWNASVLVTVPYFYAENIIFENSFNQYVSPKEAQDTLVDLFEAPIAWTEKERPKRPMPARPKEPYSTEVQHKFYIERASAISFTEQAQNAVLENCRVIGHQDAFYGDFGASVMVMRSILQGGVDYIFGGLKLTVMDSELVAQISADKGDKCYIAASRAAMQESILLYRDQLTQHAVSLAMLDSIPEAEITLDGGMDFYDCVVRFATTDEMVDPGHEPVWLGRPWRWWGRTAYYNVRAAEGVLRPEGDRWSLGLTKGHIAPFCFEEYY